MRSILLEFISDLPPSGMPVGSRMKTLQDLIVFSLQMSGRLSVHVRRLYCGAMWTAPDSWRFPKSSQDEECTGLYKGVPRS